MTVDIGIVGAGTAGLHLALMLQQRGVDATLYAERTADEVLAGRLANTVAHHHHTRERERELGVNHWDETGPSYGRHWHYFGGEQPLAFPGDFAAPSLAVDYRLYQSRLLEDFEERGGTVRFGVVDAASCRAAGCGARSGRRLHRPGRLVGSLPARARPVARRAAPAPLRRPVRGDRLPRPGRSDVRRLAGPRRADRDPAPDLRGERDDAAVRGGARRRPGGALAHAVRRRSRRLRAARAGEAARALPARLRARRSRRVRAHASQQHRAGRGHADRAGSPSRRSTTAPARSRWETPTSSSTRWSGRARTRRRSRPGRSARRSSRTARSTRRSAAAWTSGGFPSCSAPTTGRTS